MSVKQITGNGIKDGGFTLIELMFVVAIIGIIASIALPNYRDYRDSSLIAEALTLPKNIQLDISEYYGHHGRFPINNTTLGLPEPEELTGNNIDSIEVLDGVLHIRFSAELGSRIQHQDSDIFESAESVYLTLRPSLPEAQPGGGSVVWLCGYAEPVTSMKAYGDNKTNVKRESLPMACW